MTRMLLLFFLLISSHTVYADDVRSAIGVSCRVVKSGYVKIDEFCGATRITTPANLPEDIQLLKDFNFSCPAGTVVSMSYRLVVVAPETKQSCPINEGLAAAMQFYQDSNCTEIWEEGETSVVSFTNVNVKHNEKLFCRTKKNDIELEKNKDIIVMILDMKFN